MNWLWFSILFLSGCVAFGNKGIVDDTAVEQVLVGQSDKDQVRAVLGDPADRRALRVSGHQREWWLYRYRSSVVNPLEYVVLVGLFVSGVGMPDRDTMLAVFFDPDGIVTSFVRARTDYRTASPLPQLSVASTTTTAVWVGQGFRFQDHTQWPDEDATGTSHEFTRRDGSDR